MNATLSKTLNATICKDKICYFENNPEGTVYKVKDGDTTYIVGFDIPHQTWKLLELREDGYTSIELAENLMKPMDAKEIDFITYDGIDFTFKTDYSFV